MPSFPARRTYRPRALALGLLVLVAAIGGAAVLGTSGHGDRVSATIGGGALGFFICAMAAIIPTRVRLEVEAGRLTPSWGRPLRVSSVEVGTWVLGGLDTAIGLVAYVRGDGRTVRVGGTGHAGEGYALTGAPTRVVDCQLEGADLDALLATLGARRDSTGPLVITLVKNSQTASGVVGMILPWLLTMVLASVFSALASTTPLLAWLGMTGMAICAGAIVLTGLVVTIVRSMRVRRPGRALRLDHRELTLEDLAGATARELARARWDAVTAVPLTYRLKMKGSSYDMPVLELTLGAAAPIVVGAWDQQQAWPAETTRTKRGAPWLVGAPQWGRLVGALRARGRLRALSAPARR